MTFILLILWIVGFKIKSFYPKIINRFRNSSIEGQNKKGPDGYRQGTNNNVQARSSFKLIRLSKFL